MKSEPSCLEVLSFKFYLYDIIVLDPGSANYGPQANSSSLLVFGIVHELRMDFTL